MRWTGITLALAMALLVSTNAQAQAHHTAKHRARHSTRRHSKHVAKKVAVAHVAKWTGAENGLLGIKLYDSGMHVLQVYGTPDEIMALNENLSAGNPGGQGGMGAPGMGGPSGATGAGGPGRNGPGMARPPGMGGPGMGGGPRGGGKGEGPDAAGRLGSEFTLDEIPELQKGGGAMGGMAPMGNPNGPGGRGVPTGPGGPGGMMGRPGGMGAPGMGGPGGMGGGVPTANGGPGDRVTFTRWVYNRAGSKYAFIIDKSGRVVQIEAIGLDNSNVRTKRGIGFGANFDKIVSEYSFPDGYEIAGDNMMMRYLVHDNVAFRLSRLETKKPQVVTGIVVSAGKE